MHIKIQIPLPWQTYYYYLVVESIETAKKLLPLRDYEFENPTKIL